MLQRISQFKAVKCGRARLLASGQATVAGIHDEQDVFGFDQVSVAHQFIPRIKVKS